MDDKTVFQSPPQGSLRPGQRLNGIFEIERLIAAGGMGEVYAAEDTELKTMIAVKTLHPHLATTPALEERFRREIQFAREGRTIDRTDLISSLWSAADDEIPNERTIDVHVRRLRAKLGDYEDIVRTVRGVGYRFDRHADVAIRQASTPSPDFF